MLPTPSTSHISFEKVYEPAEDSFLLLDTLSSDTEKAFLQERFHNQTLDDVNPSLARVRTPLIVEVGSGSGVLISFVHAHCESILGRSDVLTAGVDINIYACRATKMTVVKAENDHHSTAHGLYLGNILGDLTSFFRSEQVDILIFNPPYVPTAKLPELPSSEDVDNNSYDNLNFLSWSYAGGIDGMETTNRFLNSLPEILNPVLGCAYVVLCAQNKPEEVKNKVKKLGSGWLVETVGQSGMHAGWEKLQIIRIWRKLVPGNSDP